MKLLLFPILLLGVLYIPSSNAYRILALLPANFRSHFVIFERIMKNLAKRGHHVDVVSHYPQEKPIPNYYDVVSLAGTTPDLSNNLTMGYIEEVVSGMSVLKFITTLRGNNACDFLGFPKMKELIQNPPQDVPYDLVFSQVYSVPCSLAVGHHLKVPVVGLSTAVLYPWMNPQIGNPANPAYVPNTLQGFIHLGSFWERLRNTVYTISDNLWYNYYTSPQDAIVRKHFGPEAPGVRELERSLALLLVNSHHSLNGIRPMSQAVVEIGGVHINDDIPELSPELKKWLDESTEGFVYFSFGSMVRIETCSTGILDSIYTSLAKLSPMRVLMKVVKKDELPPGLPKNVLTLPWVPQYQVLKHKNVRAFITHGGLLGTQEAVVCGVPMVGIPLFADQDLNINVYVKKRIAVHLNYKDITVKNLDAALSAVLNDPTYRKEARKLSAQFLDRPMSAIDTAIYWIEYVARNGPTTLRSPLLDLTWWQVALIDVFGFLLLVVLLLAYMLKLFAKKIISIGTRGTRNRVPKTKKGA